jgi:virulence-associated protein VapD
MRRTRTRPPSGKATSGGRMYAVAPESAAPDSVRAPNAFRWSPRVYAVAFDLDTEQLKQHYHGPSWQNAYADIFRVFQRHGFERQQGSVYFGNQSVDPVRCVLAVQETTRTYPWFRLVVSDIRMLRIEENNDLMPAIEPQGDLPLGSAD